MTTTLEGGEWSAAHPSRTLPPGKTLYPFYRRLGGPQGRSGWAENLVPTRIRSQTIQPIVSRYTDWATQPTNGKLTGRNQALVSVLIKLEHHAMTQWNEGKGPVFYNIWHYVEVSG